MNCKNHTSNLVKKLKRHDQDFDWYPTTPEIIATIKGDMDSGPSMYLESDCLNLLEMNHINHTTGHSREGKYIGPSVLDIGSGDGRVLEALTKGNRYAIEKSEILRDELDKKTFVIGVDFFEQTLMDKRVAVIFSNPPYSIYERFVEKIIMEANSKRIYLVIPSRWVKSKKIEVALNKRGLKAEVLATSDFDDGDRLANVDVDVIKISLHNLTNESNTPFGIWFSEAFKLKDVEKSAMSVSSISEEMSKAHNKVNASHELVMGDNIVTTLTELHDFKMNEVFNTVKSFEAIDPNTLSDLGISIHEIRNALEHKVKSLKNMFWRELFGNLDKITDRLTDNSRKMMLDSLLNNMNVDFTVTNAHQVILWAIKNSNDFIEKQVTETCEDLVEQANVKLYKSNQKTFGDNCWRYGEKPSNLDKFQFEYRIILEGHCQHTGIYSGGSSSSYSINNLKFTSASLVNDLCTVANNLGFNTIGMERVKDFEWKSGKKCLFHYKKLGVEKPVELFVVKAYKKGTLHITFNQEFMARLNVEFGRLKGWVHSAQEAKEEMDLPEDVAIKAFGSNTLVGAKSLPQLGLTA